MKRGILLLLGLILLASLVSAQGEKIEVSTLKEGYTPGEVITFKVSLFDSQNKPLNVDVQVAFENAAKTKRVEATVASNRLVDMNLDEKSTAGYWSVTAKYGGIESKALFIIETSELVRFDLEGDILTITNIGNTPYTRDVQILIGDTLGVKKTGLDVGEKVSFRLIAPNGVYSVRVTDGKTTFSRADVALTGNAIGILDERIKSSNPITGARLSEESDNVFLFNKSNIFAYVFILVIVGAAILLVIERSYARSARK